MKNKNEPILMEVAPTLDMRSGRSGENSFATSGGLIPEIARFPVGIDGSETGFALRAAASHSGDKGDGGVNTSFVVSHALKAEGFDASEDGTGRGVPLVPEIVGALSDGAHMGGGQNGQDAYTGRIFAVNLEDIECRENGKARLGNGDVCSGQPRGFL